MSALDVMTELGVGDGYIYINDSDISSFNYISSQRLGYLYYGVEKELDEIKYTESYCIYMSKSISLCEIHIFKAKYRSDVDLIMTMLESRAALLSHPQINPHSSSFLAPTGIECRVFSKGRYVFLLAGENREVQKRIEELF